MTHKTPLQAIRLRCLDCSGYEQAQVKGCRLKDCDLWPYRMGHSLTNKRPRTLKIIKAHCIDCCGGSVYEPRKCYVEDCALFSYRLGRNPNLVGKRVNNLRLVSKIGA